jgi:sulfate transport system permease protein
MSSSTLPRSAIASGIGATSKATSEPAFVRWLLIGIALLFLALFLFLPLGVVFYTALGKGVRVYLQTFRDPDTRSAIRLTLLAAGFAVPLNMVFGVAAAWAIGKFDFVGKSLLITLIDLPFSVSPRCFGFDLRAALRPAGFARAVADRP